MTRPSPPCSGNVNQRDKLQHSMLKRKQHWHIVGQDKEATPLINSYKSTSHELFFFRGGGRDAARCI